MTTAVTKDYNRHLPTTEKLISGSRAAGFTLLEVLVALTIFLIVSGLMAPAFIVHLKFNVASVDRSAAMAAVVQRLDELRLFDPATLPTSGTVTETTTVNDRILTLHTIYCPSTTYCTTRTRHIRVEVEYRNETIYHVETVFTQLS